MVVVVGDTSPASGLLIAGAGTVGWQGANTVQAAVTKTLDPELCLCEEDGGRRELVYRADVLEIRDDESTFVCRSGPLF